MEAEAKAKAKARPGAGAASGQTSGKSFLFSHGRARAAIGEF